MSIKDMTNAELCAHLRGLLRGDLGEEIELALIERIEQLENKHRWVSIDESEPNRGDIVLVKGTVTGDVCKPFEGQMGLVEWGSRDYSLCVDSCYYSVWYSDITEWRLV
jgi:hypothetical protein